MAIRGSGTYLVYIPSRYAILKSSLIKIYEDRITSLEGVILDGNTDLEGDRDELVPISVDLPVEILQASQPENSLPEVTIPQAI